MSSSLLAFRLSTPIADIEPEAIPRVEDDQSEWHGAERAQAGCYCTTRGSMGVCRPRYYGGYMTCTDWGWGTLECWCVPY